MPARTELRIGLVGFGRVVQDLHLPAWRTVPDARIVAVADASPAALSAAEGSVPRAARYSDLDRLLRHPGGLDAVALCTPGVTHRALGEVILDAGVPLLCEKPLATTLEDARVLWQKAVKSGVPLTPVQNYRFRPHVRQAFAAAARGLVGSIEQVGVRHLSGPLAHEPTPWMRDERRNRVLLFDFGIHFVDIAVQLAGAAVRVNRPEAKLDDVGLRDVVFTARHEGGIMATYEFGRDAACPSTRLTARGSGGEMTLDFYPDGFHLDRGRRTPLGTLRAEVRRAAGYGGARLAERLPRALPRRAWGHARLFQNYAQFLRGQGSNPVDPEGVLRAIEVLDSVAEASYAQATTTMEGGAP